MRQMERLNDFIAIKRRLASRYAEALSQIGGITVMPEAPWTWSTYWLYTILVDPKDYGIDSRELLQELARRRIQARPLWQALHRSPAQKGQQACESGVADNLNRQALSLPSSVGLTEEEQRSVIEAIVSRGSSRS